MADIKITEEIRAVLDKCEFTETTVKLPDGQLDRALYVKINKLFEECGGVWKKGPKVHVFPSDPKEKLGLIVESGVLVDEQKLFQAFFTPPELAKRVVEISDVEDKICLEPSAGHGALADEIMKNNPYSLRCIELNPKFAEVLKSKNHTVEVGDFLARDFEPVYDRIVMNSPFNKNQWFKHFEHAYKALSTSGKLVAILPNSIHSNKKFQDFVSDKRWEFEPVAGGSFEDTDIETNIVTIYK